MKQPDFDIHNKVYVALVPGMYEGAFPGMDATTTYLFDGYVTGLKWHKEADTWLYEVSTVAASFWVFMEYLDKQQDVLVRRMMRGKA